MSKFEVKVYKLEIEPHGNADSLELARVGDYRSVVRKGQFTTGDRGVYIPEGSIVPDWLLRKMGLWKTDRDVGKGMLAGSSGNRVKAQKFRGALSQGLIYKIETEVQIFCDQIDVLDWLILEDGSKHLVEDGDDVTELLGISKYEPPIPIHMSGEVWNAFGHTVPYDIENIKKYNRVLEDGEDVVVTEKIHGTFGCIGFDYVNRPNEDGVIVHSKGLGGQGLAFKINEANKDNLYVRTALEIDRGWKESPAQALCLASLIHSVGSIVYFLGEIFGPVQDLKYGFTKPQFRVFDIYVGQPGHGHYMDYDKKVEFCQVMGLQMVPILYRGPFSKEKIEELTTGKETVSGMSVHLREGVVITPSTERTNQWIGRVILKSVSEDYLLRKGEATEFN
jgi:RNA ligase (TIGR02306 family)